MIDECGSCLSDQVDQVDDPEDECEEEHKDEKCKSETGGAIAASSAIVHGLNNRRKLRRPMIQDITIIVVWPGMLERRIQLRICQIDAQIRCRSVRDELTNQKCFNRDGYYGLHEIMAKDIESRGIRRRHRAEAVLGARQKEGGRVDGRCRVAAMVYKGWSRS